MRKLIRIVIWCFLLATQAALANQHIGYIGVEAGMSNNAVTSICKDQYGFIWLGTYDGLNRYDGTSFRTYRNVWNDSTSLNNNHINKVTEADHRIFAGTLKGLVYYDYNDAKFHPVYYKDGITGTSAKITFGISALCNSRSQIIYAGTDFAGLFVYNVKEKAAHRVALRGSYAYGVQSITSFPDGRVLLFVPHVGLCQLVNEQKIVVLCNQLTAPACLTTDQQNNVWIGNDDGLFKFNPSLKKIQNFNLVNDKFSSTNIIEIRFAKSGRLWVGTDGGGLHVVDTLQHKTVQRITTGSDPTVIKSNAISALYEDEQARIWVATLRGGVNVIDDKVCRFTTIAHDPFNANSVVNNFSLSFCEDESHNLWIGTDGGGLSYWNRKEKNFTNYVHTDNKNSIASNFVVSIVKDKKNRLWFGLYNGGIDRLDKLTGRFIHYSCFNPVMGLSDKYLWKLYLDKHDRLWAGTTREGALYLYNAVKDKFELFDSKLTDIHALCEDSNGNLWAGDYSRLIRIEVGKKRHEYLSVKSAVRSIVESPDHHLWIGTEGGGLIEYNPGTKELKRYTEQDGLPSNSILNVLVDQKGNLWCSTYNGLTRYDRALRKFRNFYASDGLQSNQFNFNAATKLSSGELVFGGINGFNIFFPGSVSIAASKPELKLTDLKVSNESIEGESVYTKGHALVDLKEITLPFNKATVSIDYTAPEYSLADKLKYAYYLEGWDHGWNNVGNLRTAYYTRLNDGTYKLHVRVSDTEGNWNSKELLLQITVLPPWYRTWWAYSIYLALIGTLVYAFWRYRIRQTRLKYEVEIANLKVEREKELNEKKLAFFTNISHEFRTPLTLIINPIKDILKKESNKDNGELTTIYRNARRLLGLVDHLLLFRKTESETDQINLVNLDFAALCYDVYSCFSHQAKIRNVRYCFSGEDKPLFIAADREKIEISLFNLISNALKFTPEGGEINIRLRECDDKVVFEVEDSGCGIADGTGEKLFDKFYQIRDNTSLKTGFGIGLYLVKSFIKSHNGSVVYCNNALGGTTFTLELPKGNQAFLPVELKNRDTGQHLIDELMTADTAEPRQADDQVNNLELLISDRQSVLIIDDNDQLRAYIRRIFKDGYKIFEAGTGEAGLEMIRTYLPDVVISDIMMDGLSGIELCSIIKQDTALNHIPVILLTGDPNPEVRLKGIEVGAVDFVSKPFEKDLLMARVKGILKDRRELQNYFYNEITLKSNARNISEHHKDFLYKCIAVIENYLMDPNFDVKTIADEMGMSYSSLFKRIKTISGQSVNSFVRFVRLRKAAELMIHTNCNINEAAFKTGFNDIKYFREHFVKQFGIKPSEFIRKHRTAFNKSYHIEQEPFGN